MTRIKKIVMILLAVLVIVKLQIVTNAETYNAYESVTDRTTVVQDLISIMRNDSKYDPYNEYVCVRTGEREYVILFGPKIEENAVEYKLIQGTYGQQTTITRATRSNNTVNKGNYTIVGNVEGTLASEKEDGYKTNYVILILGIMLILLNGFRLFRKSQGAKVSYYGMR